jgi:hypothetical protein
MLLTILQFQNTILLNFISENRIKQGIHNIIK